MKKAIGMVLVLVLVIGIAAVFAGCGESQEQEKQALATDLKGLQTSLTELVSPDTYKSFDTFDKAWTQIQKEYEKVVADAEKLKETDIADLKSSYDDLKKALGNVTSDQSLQQKANSILTASTNFLTALQQLINSINPPK